MSVDISTIAKDTGGDITLNQKFMECLVSGEIGKYLIEVAKKGTPLLKLGSGSPCVFLCAGIHGN
jgi:hypothetical protein